MLYKIRFYELFCASSILYVGEGFRSSFGVIKGHSYGKAYLQKENRKIPRTLPVQASSASRNAEDARYIRALEEDYWKSLDPISYKISRQQSIGFAMLIQGDLEAALKAYDTAHELGPKRHLWHRGLALFYLGRYTEAAAQFKADAQIFERDFNECATDERIWMVVSNALAETKIDLSPASDLPEDNPIKRNLASLFNGLLNSVEDIVIPAESENSDPSGRSFFRDFYLGLWYEINGNQTQAAECMWRARESKYPQKGDLWGILPGLHIESRCWDLKHFNKENAES